MDFFAHQDTAQANSRRLVLLFLLAVVGVIGLINLVGYWGWYFFTGGADLPKHFYATNSFIVLLYVGGSAWLESSNLSEGGSALAHRIGAQTPHVHDLRHKRLINISEELAIAAGIAVPEVFILDDDSINALAAGPDTASSVIVVTRGALESLTRDELQGVVAHEVAHIVNGDAALNTRLVGGLYGLCSLHMFGMSLIALGGHSFRGRKSENIGLSVFLVLGALFALAGWVGKLAGSLVQAGISRQREYLADAMAVKLTRSRDGLGTALRKVGGQTDVPENKDYCELVSHLWLNNPSEAGWFDTHPPLMQRVRRLYGRPLPVIRPQTIDVNDDEFEEKKSPELGLLNFGDGSAGEMAIGVLATAALATDAAKPDGRPKEASPAGDGAEQINLASGTDTPTQALPRHSADNEPQPVTPADILLQAARELEPSVSRAALFINAIVAGPVAAEMLEPAEAQSEPDDLHYALLWLEEPKAQWLRVPLIEILVARIRDWPLECRRTLVRYCHDAVLADGRVEKTEWIYFTLVRHRLLPAEAKAVRKFSAADKRRALAEVFSMAGHMSEQSARAIRDAVAAAAAEIGVPQPPETPEQFEFRSLTRALDVLSTIAPLRKPRLLRILENLARVKKDPAYTAFLTAVAAAIDCPPLSYSMQDQPTESQIA